LNFLHANMKWFVSQNGKKYKRSSSYFTMGKNLPTI
jgi:hypothetical protein